MLFNEKPIKKGELMKKAPQKRVCSGWTHSKKNSLLSEPYNKIGVNKPETAKKLKITPSSTPKKTLFLF